jgi:hypothetical protein
MMDDADIRHSRGLLYNVGQLLTDTDPAAFLDLELVCQDGTIRWNKLLLAANSSLLCEILQPGWCHLILNQDLLNIQRDPFWTLTVACAINIITIVIDKPRGDNYDCSSIAILLNITFIIDATRVGNYTPIVTPQLWPVL